MRYSLLVISLLLLLCVCTATSPGGLQPAAALWPAVPESDAPAETLQMLRPTSIPGPGLSPEEVIEAYFREQYAAYCALAYVDIGGLLDLSQQTSRNILAWSQMLAMRRRLLHENELCYVETAQYPYSIVYEEADEDGRTEFWRRMDEEAPEEERLTLHLRIKGEAGRAYPPIMAVNAQHSFTLRRVDGEWKILRHYFPGSVRKFMRSTDLAVPTEAQMLAALRREFAPAAQPESADLPAGATRYDAALAAGYARRYTEEANPAFYKIGDWMGNCANFVSQSVWAGFTGGDDSPHGGRGMTGEWYGGDGGTPAWENVNHFWAYITGDSDLAGAVLEGADALRAGDIIQTRPAGGDGDEERFNHMLLVVDGDTLLLAQNSPGSFVHYADLVNVETRLVRPFSVVD